MIDRQEALDLYNRGKTLSSIGNQFGVSRQRVWQVLKPYSKLITYNHSHVVLKKNPRASEIVVANKLLSLGAKEVEFQPYNFKYDLLVNGKKIEIKHSSKSGLVRKGTSRRYHGFSNLKQSVKVDFFIFVVGQLTNPRCYIMPFSEVGNYVTIPVEPFFNTKRERLYRERWDLLL